MRIKHYTTTMKSQGPERGSDLYMSPWKVSHGAAGDMVYVGKGPAANIGGPELRQAGISLFTRASPF